MKNKWFSLQPFINVFNQVPYQQFASVSKVSLDLISQISIGKLEIFTQVSVVTHDGKISITRNVNQLNQEKFIIITTKLKFKNRNSSFPYSEILPLNNRDIHVVSWRTDIFQFLSIEDVNSDHVNLSMAMFTCLWCGHFNNLARPRLQIQKRFKFSLTSSKAQNHHYVNTFNMTKPFFRRAEHCMGKVADAPESPDSNWVSSSSAMVIKFRGMESNNHWKYK